MPRNPPRPNFLSVLTGVCMSTKFIFVTGGVVSSIGKGITTASLGRLLRNRGFGVTMTKLETRTST